ncbi:AAA family ATPase [Lacrimispora amygdalina]|uniref:SF1B family DNA helicase RecD2 n=1 Tax=Lacrimispora amygdalina TaxID=253257 RepID=UPI000BE3C047|nr:AAA family ATPase [Lacrimispora amygdalina]
MVNHFECVLKNIYRRDNYTGNTIFGVETDEIDVRRNRNGEVVCEGIVPNWPIDLQLIIDGEWNEDGTCFYIETAKPYTATEELSKKLIKRVIKELKEENEEFKVGSNLTKKIIEVSGPDILKFISNSKSLDNLIDYIKVDEWKIIRIHESLASITESYSVVDFVSHFGCSISLCDKLVKKYGTTALRRLKAHPYRIGYSIGMDFCSMDKIGKYRKFDPLSKERVTAIIYEALNSLLKQQGSTYIIQSMLKKQIDKVIKKSSYPETMIPFAYIGTILGKINGIKTEIATNGVRIYRTDFYEAEWSIAKDLSRLNKNKKAFISDIQLTEMIVKRELEFKMSYSAEQKASFQAIKTTGIKIITGGPGVGKTTTINGLITSYMELFPDKKIALAAPTGRAAQRMWDITMIEAKTIHKLLDFKPFEIDNEESGTYRNKDNPIDADMIVIDEMSMVDTELFYLLLQAIKTDTIVLLIGDKDQLQSVSPGNVLHDLIKSGRFELYQLTKVYRQKGDNTIIDNAYKILSGRMDFTKNKKFEIVEAESEKEAVNTIVNKFIEWFKKEDLKKIQILSPVKSGECGISQINTIIAKEIRNELSESSSVFYFGKTSYRIGDKVIFHENNYKKDYYNGDIGYVTDILKNGIEVEVGTDIKKITGDALKDITLAYAITMHKSQGSEFEDIIIMLPDTNKNMLNRNLLFTAVTRAKNRVLIVYTNSALSDSIHTIIVNKRYTGLVDKIRKVMVD